MAKVSFKAHARIKDIVGKDLINNNVDVQFNAGGYFSLTAMSVAIYSENEMAVYALLNSKKMGNINAYLNLACNFNNIQIIKYLYEFGADVNYVDEKGYNCIMYATSFSTIDIMHYLIDKNVDVNIGRRLGDGATALILAIYVQDIDKINILLQAGANKNVVNVGCETPYEIAKRYSQRLDDNQRQRLLELLK